MRLLKYSFVGGIIGLTIGVLAGMIFGIFYVKKSEIKTKQTIQTILFGTIGTFCGIGIGRKFANEQDLKEINEINYKQSFVKSICQFCLEDFEYSTQKYSKKLYCDTCINSIKQDYILKCNEINKYTEGLDNLKMSHAINTRLEKMKKLAESLLIYENVDLDFITKKPSEIISSIEKYREDTV